MAKKKPSDQDQQFDVLTATDKAGEFAEKAWKPVALAIGAVVIIMSIFSLTQGQKAKAEKKHFGELYSATKIYKEKKEAFEKAQKPDSPADKDGSEDKKVSEKPKPPTGDLQKDYGDVVAPLESFLSKNSNTQAAGEAALILASLYQEYDQKQKAVDSLKKVEAQLTTGTLIGDLVKMKLGDLHSELDQCKEAVAPWQKLASGEGFLKEESILKIGLCHQKLGQLSDAKVWYQKITDVTIPEGKDDKRDQQIVNSARKYLKFLKFQEKIGSQAPAKVDPVKDVSAGEATGDS